MKKRLTQKQIDRQDYVDNAIYEMLLKVNPTRRKIKWNIETIGMIRDIIKYSYVKRLRITDEMTFYPYIDEDV